MSSKVRIRSWKLLLSYGIVMEIVSVSCAVLAVWLALVLDKRLLFLPSTGVLAPMVAAVIAIQQIC